MVTAHRKFSLLFACRCSRTLWLSCRNSLFRFSRCLCFFLCRLFLWFRIFNVKDVNCSCPAFKSHAFCILVQRKSMHDSGLQRIGPNGPEIVFSHIRRLSEKLKNPINILSFIQNSDGEIVKLIRLIICFSRINPADVIEALVVSLQRDIFLFIVHHPGKGLSLERFH